MVKILHCVQPAKWHNCCWMPRICLKQTLMAIDTGTGVSLSKQLLVASEQLVSMVCADHKIQANIAEVHHTLRNILNYIYALLFPLQCCLERMGSLVSKQKEIIKIILINITENILQQLLFHNYLCYILIWHIIITSLTRPVKQMYFAQIWILLKKLKFSDHFSNLLPWNLFSLMPIPIPLSVYHLIKFGIVQPDSWGSSVSTVIDADVRLAFPRVILQKATGPDGVPRRILGTCVDQLEGVLTDISNLPIPIWSSHLL